MTNTTPQSELAAGLCSGQLPSREIAGMLYLQASLEAPIIMPTAPDHQSALLGAKTGWVKMVTAIQSEVPELTGAGGMSLRTVRAKRSYILHGTDVATLEGLENYAWADPDTTRAWAEKVDPTTLLRRIVRGETFANDVYVGLGRNLVRHGIELESSVFRVKDRLARDSICAGIVLELIVQVVASRGALFVAKLGPRKKTDIVREALALTCEPLDAKHLDVIEAMVGQAETRKILDGEASNISHTDAFLARLFATYPEIAPDYVDSEDVAQWVDQLASIGTANAVRVLLSGCADGQTVGAAHVQSAVRTHLHLFKSFGGGWDSEFLVNCNYRLDDDIVLHILRNTNADATVAWLSGECINKPTVEMIAALYATPGAAFNDRWGSEFDRWTLPSFFRHLCAHLENILNQPWSDTIVDVFGADFTRVLINAATDDRSWYSDTRNAAAAYLARRFSGELGDDVEAWRLGVAAVPGSTQSLGRTLRGIQRIVRTKPTK